MTKFSGSLRSVREELPEAAPARWASVFFSCSVLTLLISIAAAQIFLALAAAAYAVQLFRARPPIQFPPIKLPLALFCLFSLLSVFWAANPGAGWFAMRKLVLFVIWLLAVNVVLSARHLELLYQALFVEAGLAGLVGTGQFIAQYRSVRALHPDRIYFYLTAERIRGFMGHWMNFGGQQMLIFAALLAFLMLTSPSVLGSAGARIRRAKTIWWIILALVATSIVLNFTRGVWLGCVVAAVYLVGRSRPRWLWALPFVLLAGYFGAPSLVRRRLEVLRHPRADPALSIRFEMWRVALRMIQKHPFWGVGPNSIEQVYVLYLPAKMPPEPGYHEHFHNDFLQFAAERGLPCLAAWIWMMVALVWNFARIRRRLLAAKGRSTWVADGAIAAWLAFMVEGCFEFNFGTSPVLMAFLFVSSTPFLAEKFETRTDAFPWPFEAPIKSRLTR